MVQETGVTTELTLYNGAETTNDSILDSVPTTTSVSVRGAITPYFYPFLDSASRRVSEIVIDYVICFSIAIIGIVANIFVIVVFAKQGFKESVAISMTTIAVWDLIKCVAGAMERFSGILMVIDEPIAVTWENISTVVFNYLICFSSYVTSVMAAYVAVERCLCVSMPLKVKWLITPKVTLTASLVISVVVFGCFGVMFAIWDIDWVWSDTYNKTIAVYRRNNFQITHEEPLFIYYNWSGILWPVIAFVIIVVATIIIAIKLRQGSKFRNEQGTGSTAKTQKSKKMSKSNNVDHEQPESNQQAQKQQTGQQLSARDRQVIKMLLVIIIIYVLSLAPRIAHYTAKYIVYDFYYLRRYHYLYTFVIPWLWIADLTNGAVNFLVFYFMSSSFKATFLSLFPSRKGKEKTAATKETSQF